MNLTCLINPNFTQFCKFLKTYRNVGFADDDILYEDNELFGAPKLSHMLETEENVEHVANAIESHASERKNDNDNQENQNMDQDIDSKQEQEKAAQTGIFKKRKFGLIGVFDANPSKTQLINSIHRNGGVISNVLKSRYAELWAVIVGPQTKAEQIEAEIKHCQKLNTLLLRHTYITKCVDTQTLRGRAGYNWRGATKKARSKSIAIEKRSKSNTIEKRNKSKSNSRQINKTIAVKRRKS